LPIVTDFEATRQDQHDGTGDDGSRSGDVAIGKSEVRRNTAHAGKDDNGNDSEQESDGECEESDEKSKEQDAHQHHEPSGAGGAGRGSGHGLYATPRQAIRAGWRGGWAIGGGKVALQWQAMSQAAGATTRAPAEVVRDTPVSQAANGICYAVAGQAGISDSELERMIAAVPRAAAAALDRKAYYFVPLTVSRGEETVIADGYDVALSDDAVCHRNLSLGDSQCVFISTRLMDDKFSVAFEFYINVGHAVVERAGVSAAFAELVWKQVQSEVRGETSLDAWESRRLASAPGPDSEKYKNEYLAAAFSDAISIYLLSLFLDIDYYDLRERDYPLLAPSPLAERLRKVAELFPPNPGFEFAIYYKRRA
jgi:hypothetical protein